MSNSQSQTQQNTGSTVWQIIGRLIAAAVVERSHGTSAEDEKLISELEAIIAEIKERAKSADQ